MYDFVSMLVNILNDSLMLFGVDLSVIVFTPGFYTDWFNVDLLTLLKIIVNIYVWVMFIRVTWNILKGIYRRVVGR